MTALDITAIFTLFGHLSIQSKERNTKYGIRSLQPYTLQANLNKWDSQPFCFILPQGKTLVPNIHLQTGLNPKCRPVLDQKVKGK